MPVTTFSPNTTIKSAEVNANFALCLLTNKNNSSTGSLDVKYHSNIASHNGFVLGTAAKATAGSGGEGTIAIYSNDAAASQLQASMVLFTSATASSRRLAFSVIEQGTGYRNITFCESGGYVGVGIAAPTNILQVKAATNKNILVSDAVALTGSVALSAINDTGGANIPFELRATEFAFTGPTAPFAISTAGNITSAGTFNGTTIPTSKTLTVTADKLSVFAATTSAELAGVISDETGSGSLVFNTSPTFTTKLTSPQIHGGVAASSSLILVSTSGVGTSDFISFNVGNNGAIEAMRILTSGKVGIGIATPQDPLQVKSSSNINFGVGAAVALSGAICLQAYNDAKGANIPMELRATQFQFSGPSSAINIDTSGQLGLGITPTSLLQLNTDSAKKPTTNTWTITSDERIKTNVVPANLDRCLEMVNTIPLKHYQWKNEVYSDNQINDRNSLGWIAQDVQKVFPKAVTINPVTLLDGSIIEDCLDLQVDQLYKTMWGAIQKLSQQNQELLTRIQNLENK